MTTINVTVTQQSDTTTESTVRGHHVAIDRPLAKEGTDKGMMGGEMLLVALGGCFMSNLLAAVRSRDAAISHMRADIAATLDSAPPRFSAIHMTVSGDYDDRALFEKLVTISERACIVANSLKDGLDLTITVA